MPVHPFAGADSPYTQLQGHKLVHLNTGAQAGTFEGRGVIPYLLSAGAWVLLAKAEAGTLLVRGVKGHG